MFIEVFTPFLNLIYAIMTSSLISIAQANKDTVARYNQSKVSHRARIWRHNKYARDGLRIIQINGLRISSSKIFHYVIWFGYLIPLSHVISKIMYLFRHVHLRHVTVVITWSPTGRVGDGHVVGEDICGRILDLEGLRKG